VTRNNLQRLLARAFWPAPGVWRALQGFAAGCSASFAFWLWVVFMQDEPAEGAGQGGKHPGRTFGAFN